MASILPFSDPRLRLRSQEVRLDDPGLSGHLQQLAGAFAAFRAVHHWGRAMAMPQLGTAMRILLFDLGSGPFLMINPEVLWRSKEMVEVWDDCMCAPEIAVRVLRHRSLTISFHDEHRKEIRMETTPESLSELVQHEIDHLDGILMTDRRLSDSDVFSRSRVMEDQNRIPTFLSPSFGELGLN